MKKLLAILLIAIVAVSVAFAGGSPEDAINNYPERSITIVVGAKTGGDVDQIARILSNALTQTSDVNVVVQNMDGNNGNVGHQYLVDSDPDGYQLLLDNGNIFTSQVTGSFIYDIDEEFVPVCTIAKADNQVIVVDASSNITTADAMAKEINANPGTVKFAATLGAPSQFHAVAMEQAMGGKFKKVDISSGSDKLVALLSGECDVVSSTQSLVKDYVTAGQIAIVGSICQNRCAFAPDTPTFAEQGYDLGPDFAATYILFAKKGTPDEIIQKFADMCETVLNDPDHVATFQALQYTPDFRGPEEAAEWYKTAKTAWFDMKDAVDNDRW